MRWVIIVVSVFLSSLSIAADPNDENRESGVVRLFLNTQLPAISSALGSTHEVLIPTNGTSLADKALKVHFSSFSKPENSIVWDLTFNFEGRSLSEMFTVRFDGLGTHSSFYDSSNNKVTELVLRIGDDGDSSTDATSVIVFSNLTMKIEIPSSPPSSRY